MCVCVGGGGICKESEVQRVLGISYKILTALEEHRTRLRVHRKLLQFHRTGKNRRDSEII